MEFCKEIKHLAHFRNSQKLHTYTEHPRQASEKSQEELLQKICKNLPASQQENCSYFQQLVRQNSHSPEFAGRQKLRTKTELFFSKKQLKIQDDSQSAVDLRHEKTVYEIELESLSRSDEFFYSIFIGGLAAANDEAVLIENLIQGVVSIGEENSPEKFTYVKNGYFLVPRSDENFIKKGIGSAYSTISSMLGKGRVLVHSSEGHTLAPALVIAFLMKKFNLMLPAAKGKVLNGHPHMLIPSSLENQLKRLH